MACFSVWDIQNCGCGRSCLTCTGLPDTLYITDVNATFALTWGTWTIPGWFTSEPGWLGCNTVTKANVVTAVPVICTAPSLGTAATPYIVFLPCSTMEPWVFGILYDVGAYYYGKGTCSGATLTADGAYSGCPQVQLYSIPEDVTATLTCDPFEISGTVNIDTINGLMVPNEGDYTITT